MIGFPEFIAHVSNVGGAPPRTPYPWQQRFAEALANEAGAEISPTLWITAPTGAGKTTAVDAAVWALAMQAHRPPVDRTVGARLIWTIDRRLLVDEVYRHATRLAERMEAALATPGDPLRGVAERLLAIADAGRWTAEFDPERAWAAGFRPLVAARWRGGVPSRLDHRSPFQPAVITSTVQQVGSRLLFRGYGVARQSRSIEAALVARDSTVFLDEAHLAAPFAETVKAVSRYQEEQPARPLTLPRPTRLVTLTATPPANAVGPIFGLDADDHARPELRRRLTAPKTLRTVDAEPKPAVHLARLALAAVSEPIDDQPPIVAVVANRVRTATEVLSLVQRDLSKDADADTLLLVGPQRPADRRRALRAVAPWLFGGERAPRPLIVVATQTFEVGLDADVTHMITQSASVSALVQRFGRVNRAGRRSRATVTVVRDERFPLYADDEPAAWAWLLEIESAGGDVSVDALSIRDRPQQAPPPHAPELTDAIVQQLAQTSEAIPAWQEPDVDGLLRGAMTDLAREVSVAWRADLASDEAPLSLRARRARRDLIALAPPRAEECTSLPISRVRELIAGASGVERRIADAADHPDAPTPNQAELQTMRHPFVVVRGREVLVGVPASRGDDGEIGPPQIAPGDVVVLPSDAGGLLSAATATASDCELEFDADDDAGPLPFVRITPALWGGMQDTSWAACVAAVRGHLSPEPAAAARPAAGWLKVLARHVRDEAALDGLAATLGEDEWAARPLDPPPAPDVGEPAAVDARGWVLRRAVVHSEEGDDPAFVSGEAPLLAEHCRAVGERAGAWASALGTDRRVVEAVRLAGTAHDLGKCDPRIQAFFAGGVRRLGQPARAKSVFGTRDPARARVARTAAGLPSRLRHEVASVAALADYLARGGSPAEAGNVADADLALLLVGTHHGWGRPSFPVPEGGAPTLPFTATAGELAGRARGDGEDGWQHGEWDQRFWRLHDECGPWALAYLEALVRLADRTVSEEGR